jgi:hypothetical protein
MNSNGNFTETQWPIRLYIPIRYTSYEAYIFPKVKQRHFHKHNTLFLITSVMIWHSAAPYRLSHNDSTPYHSTAVYIPRLLIVRNYKVSLTSIQSTSGHFVLDACRYRSNLVLKNSVVFLRWKAESRSASQEILRLLWNPKIHFCYQQLSHSRCPQPGNSVHVLPPHFLHSAFNIILPSTPRSSKGSLSSTFSDKFL